jgi:hypothetical protein
MRNFPPDLAIHKIFWLDVQIGGKIIRFHVMVNSDFDIGGIILPNVDIPFNNIA